MSIEEHRKRIDALDEQIVALLNERARLAGEIGHEKQQEGKSAFDPVREQAVIEAVSRSGAGPLRAQNLLAIYREVLSACRAMQRPVVVAYHGPEGSWHHSAARQVFGSSAALKAAPDIPAVFDAAEREQADYAVVAIENSSEGQVGATLDRLVDTPLRICAEIFVDVHHCLVGRGELARVRRVYSFPLALEQCANWLRRNLPNAEWIEVANTAAGAERASQDEEGAAVASREAAHIWQLSLLAENIEDYVGNRTRFLVLGREQPPPTGADKTSLVVSTAHKPGALYAFLAPFAERHLNLTMIQSRPVKTRRWEYLFFVDLSGHQGEPMVAAALEASQPHCLFFKVLGSYPEGR